MPHNHSSNRLRSSSLPRSHVMPAGQASSDNDAVYARLQREASPARIRQQSPYRNQMPEGYVPLAAMSKNSRLARQFPLYSTSQDMTEEYVPLAAMSRNNRLVSIRRNKQTYLNKDNVSSIYQENSIADDLPSPPSTESSHSSDRLSGIINEFPTVAPPQRGPSTSKASTSRISRRESLLRQFPKVPAPPQVPLPNIPGKRRYSSLGNIGQVSQLHQTRSPENNLNTGHAHRPTGFVNIEDYYVELFSETPKIKRQSSFSLVRKLSGSFRKMFKRGKDGKYQ